MNVELRPLQYFLAVAEELHFGRAAARIPISQPALSKAIRELERTIGVDLFVRTSRSVRLTDAGQALRRELPRTLDDLDRVLEHAHRVGHGETGLLTVSFVPSAAITLLPHVVRTFGAAFPTVTLRLEELLDEEQFEGLLGRRIDVAVLRSTRDDDELRFEPLWREPTCVFLPVSHRLANRRTLSFADFQHESLVLWPRHEAPDTYDEIVSSCRAAGFSPEIAQEASGPYTILGLVAAGVGITVLARSYGRLGRDDVIAVPLKRTQTMLYLGRRRDDGSALAENFVEVARRAARRLRP